jgi:hypothetical protein
MNSASAHDLGEAVCAMIPGNAMYPRQNFRLEPRLIPFGVVFRFPAMTNARNQ